LSSGRFAPGFAGHIDRKTGILSVWRDLSAWRDALVIRRTRARRRVAQRSSGLEQAIGDAKFDPCIAA
jgi:hypothetical protein